MTVEDLQTPCHHQNAQILLATVHLGLHTKEPSLPQPDDLQSLEDKRPWCRSLELMPKNLMLNHHVATIVGQHLRQVIPNRSP